MKFILDLQDIHLATIIGNWTWIDSKGGIAPITYTPASTGKIIILTITANEVIEKTNGVITNTWAYSINTQNSIFGGSRQMLIFSTRVNQSYEIIENQLLLNDECFDCLSNKFSRI